MQSFPRHLHLWFWKEPEHIGWEGSTGFYWNQKFKSVGSVAWSNGVVFLNRCWTEEWKWRLSPAACWLWQDSLFLIGCGVLMVRSPKLIQRASNLRHYEMTARRISLSWLHVRHMCHRVNKQQTQSNTCNIAMVGQAEIMQVTHVRNVSTSHTTTSKRIDGFCSHRTWNENVKRSAL